MGAYEIERFRNDRMREVAAVSARYRKQDERRVVALAAAKWLKSLRDEFPGLVQGSDEAMLVLAGEVADLILARR